MSPEPPHKEFKRHHTHQYVLRTKYDGLNRVFADSQADGSETCPGLLCKYAIEQAVRAVNRLTKSLSATTRTSMY